MRYAFRVDLGTLSQTLLRKLLERSFLRTSKNFNQGDFYPLLFVVLIFCSRLRATHSGCFETNSVNGIGTAVASLPLPDRNGIDLGALPQPPLKNFLKEVS